MNLVHSSLWTGNEKVSNLQMKNSSGSKNNSPTDQQKNRSPSLFDLLEGVFYLIIKSISFFIAVSLLLLFLSALYQRSQHGAGFLVTFVELTREYFNFSRKCFFFSTADEYQNGYQDIIYSIFSFSLLLSTITLSATEFARGIETSRRINQLNNLRMEKKFSRERNFLEEKIIKSLDEIQNRVLKIHYDFFDVFREIMKSRNPRLYTNIETGSPNSSTGTEEIQKRISDLEAKVGEIREEFEIDSEVESQNYSDWSEKSPHYEEDSDFEDTDNQSYLKEDNEKE